MVNTRLSPSKNRTRSSLLSYCGQLRLGGLLRYFQKYKLPRKEKYLKFPIIDNFDVKNFPTKSSPQNGNRKRTSFDEPEKDISVVVREESGPAPAGQSKYK